MSTEYGVGRVLLEVKKATGTGRTFTLRSQVCFVTWARSRVEDSEEFYRMLVRNMPDGTKIFGAKEYHQDGTLHYHAVIMFADRIYWKDARMRFTLVCDDGEVDTRAINIE